MIKQCMLCNKTFKTYHNSQQFCSYKCSAIYRAQKKPKISIIKICKWCNKTFSVFPSQLKQGKGQYCSKKCSGLAHNKRIGMECPICKKYIKVRRDRVYTKEGNFCSKECSGIAHSKFMKGKIPSKPFQKNHTAWNKGTKGICKPNSGSFKKGRKGLRGKNSPCWKGGKLTRFGYKVISHPNLKYNNGVSRYVFEHRYIMEQHLGRTLYPDEIIHHRNGIKTDNRIENLQLVLRKTHFGNVRCPHCLKEFLIK